MGLDLFFVVRVFVYAITRGPRIVRARTFATRGFVFGFVVLPVRPRGDFRVPFGYVLGVLASGATTVLGDDPYDGQVLVYTKV